MNGTSRLYRSTSEAMIGGVAAGLGNYFKVDPIVIRAAFLGLAFLSGGAFILVYLALWLLLPTAGSTATQPGDIVRENLNDLGSRVRGYSGMSQGTGMGTGTAAPINGQPVAANNPPQLPPATPTARTRQGISPQALIMIGGFFLLLNMGLFRGIHWGFWWPLLLVGLGVMMLSRRNA